MTQTLLSFGHGYSAGVLGQRLRARGWRVIGTTRSAERAEALAAQGVEPLVWPGGDVTGADIAGGLRDASHLLISVVPEAEGCPVALALGAAIAQARPAWIGYLSTTGVYGDQGGAWVDEDTSTAAARPRSQARVLAESQWQALAEACGARLGVFRLAGIYGPGRGPLERVRAGTAQRIIKPGQVFSRIHVEDIAGAVEAAIDRGAGGTWNICDDEPAPADEVIAHAARLLGLPLPPAIAFEDAGLTGMALSFYAENRKVRNDRMKRALGYALRFPSYREGLADMVGARGA